jgi:LysR family transcriptional regulator, low CO2-responsive transcriptional regulator
MSVTVTQLRALVAVAHGGTVQRAADRLGVSQPSVSAAVAGLSRELGVVLLERDGRRSRLTPAGLAYLPHAEAVLGLLEQGRAAAQEALGGASTTLHVIAVNTAGEYLLPALIQEYRQAEPDVQVLLEVGNRREVIDRLRAHTADIGIAGRPPARDLIGRPFADNDLVVVGRDADAVLADTPWLMREPGSGTRATLEAYLSGRGIDPPERLTLGSNGALKQALAVGMGVTLISRHAVARELEEGSLVVLKAPGTPLHRPFHVLLARSPAPRPAVRRFAAFLHAR